MTEVIHRIVDVRYSELWCQCTCGVIVRSADYWQMPDDWKAHRKAVGAGNVAMSDAARSNSWIDGFKNSRRKAFSMKSDAIRRAESKE